MARTSVLLASAGLAVALSACSQASPEPRAPIIKPEERGAALPPPVVPPAEPRPAAVSGRIRETIVIGRGNTDLVYVDPQARVPNSGEGGQTLVQVPASSTTFFGGFGGYYPGYGPRGTNGEPGRTGAAPGQPVRPPTTVGGDWAAPKDASPGMIKNWQAR